METMQSNRSQSADWARHAAHEFTNQGDLPPGPCLILGASDTGKTTLAHELAGQLCTHVSVALIDADIGQSRIGPPATIGWTILNPKTDLHTCPTHGIRFVGDITPVAHLLQFTAALVHCLHAVSQTACHTIIDTPGLVSGSAATALWWTVCDIIRPTAIITLQRQSELADVLKGLANLAPLIKTLTPPSGIPAKSPQRRRAHRSQMFARYFYDSTQYNLQLSQVALRTCRHISEQDYEGRLIALRNDKDEDMALALIKRWLPDEDTTTVTAPPLDFESVCCILVGDARMDIA